MENCEQLISGSLDSVVAETSKGLPSVFDFESLFEDAAALTKSGHEITKSNLSHSEGQLMDTFSIALSDSVMMNIQVVNENQETAEISILSSGGDTNEAMSFLYAVGEILYSTEAISDMQEVGNVLGLLNFFDNLDGDDENCIEINGIEYGYITSHALGIMMFYARKPE